MDFWSLLLFLQAWVCFSLSFSISLHHHHHLFLKCPSLHAQLGLDVFPDMRLLHISLNTTHSECKPSSSISSFTHSLQVFVPLSTHLTPTTTTFLQADTPVLMKSTEIYSPPQTLTHNLTPSSCMWNYPLKTQSIPLYPNSIPTYPILYTFLWKPTNQSSGGVVDDMAIHGDQGKHVLPPSEWFRRSCTQRGPLYHCNSIFVVVSASGLVC